MSAIVRMLGVTKTYSLGRVAVPALRGVDLEVPEHAFCALAGRSGSGKTTLLNLVGCIDPPTAGELVVAGRDLSRIDERERTRIRRDVIGFVFQSFNLVPVLTAAENVELSLVLRGGMRGAERRRTVATLLERVGIASFAHHRPAELSGGQRQRVAIARALVGRPALVLADEPTANLDGATGAAIVDLMREMNAALGTTFVLSTHDPAVTARASTIVHVVDGRVAPAAAEARRPDPAALSGSAA